MKWNRRFTAAILLTVVAVMFSACSGGKEEAPAISTAPPEPTASPSPTPEPAKPFAAPLTGIGRDTEATARPVAVMVNNLKPARPQSGLANADVVWEALAEGGITRLVAIFQSTDNLTDPIGPVRSIRPYLIELGETYGAVLAHAGGSNDAYAILQTQDKPYLDEISNAGGYFWRSKDRKAPHNLYTDLGKLRAAADKKGYRTDASVPSYPFDENGATGGGAPAANVEITFSLKDYVVKYAYDASSGLYLRSIGDEPHTDLNVGEQLAAANLAVIGADHRTLDNEGRLAVDLKKGGDALLIQKGKAVQCEWIRADDGMIRLVKDGAELPLVPGKTFFHIVPNSLPLAEHVTYG